ncbi:hypothetical protein QA601_18865, partial [Chitinispirillales bacterium ANBcel5]|uniref:hypothetical protein n=1 Tax=Cellulosispirillum alkaliphilum TaxID=3039283 RepID=UPI002A53E9D5|nr:hypothetical protein [Chitinispirillales bacterium ANBcel5]
FESETEHLSYLLIDDFEDGDLISRGGGDWYTGSDDEVQEPLLPGNSTSSIEVKEVRINHYFRKGLVWEYTLGDNPVRDSTGFELGNWVWAGVTVGNFNAEGFDGIAFIAKSDTSGYIEIEAKIDGITSYRKGIELSTEWEFYHIPFDELEIVDSGDSAIEFDPARITNFGFHIGHPDSNGDSGEIIITDLQLYTEAEVVVVEATKSGNGRIYPHGETVCIEGLSQEFTFIPDFNTSVYDVLVNGVSAGTCSTYTFSADSSGTVHVIFESETEHLSYLFMDDFEDGDLISRGGGDWYTGSDAEEQEPRTPGNSTSSIEIEEVTADHYSGKGLVWRYTLGDIPVTDSTGFELGNWVWTGVTVGNFNAEGFDGIAFIAKSDTSVYMEIEAKIEGITSYRKGIELSTEWEFYHIPFDELEIVECADSAIEFDPAKITNFGFHIGHPDSNGDTDEIIITDLRLYTEGEVVVVEATKIGDGRIYPHGETVCIEGLSQDFTFIPDSNAFISDVIVNGVSTGACSTYTFSADSSGTVHVIFEPEPIPLSYLLIDD